MKLFGASLAAFLLFLCGLNATRISNTECKIFRRSQGRKCSFIVIDTYDGQQLLNLKISLGRNLVLEELHVNYTFYGGVNGYSFQELFAMGGVNWCKLMSANNARSDFLNKIIHMTIHSLVKDAHQLYMPCSAQKREIDVTNAKIVDNLGELIKGFESSSSIYKLRFVIYDNNGAIGALSFHYETTLIYGE